MIEPLLTDKELASYLKLTTITIRNYRLSGKGPPAIYLSCRCIRYRREDVEKWLDEQIAPMFPQGTKEEKLPTTEGGTE